MTTTTFSGWSFQTPLLPTGIDEAKRAASLGPVQRSFWQSSSLQDQLNALQNLPENWDSYGAARIDDRALTTARATLDLLRIPPDQIEPSASGTVLYEWAFTLGKASLEFGAENFGFYAAPKVGDPIYLAGSSQELNADDINRAVETLAGGRVSTPFEAGNTSIRLSSLCT